MEQILLDCNAIQKYIPHRSPFLFLDNIQRIEFSPSVDLLNFSFRELAGSYVVASFRLNPEHPFLMGQSQTPAQWPAVLHIETMAQAACFVLNCLESSYGSSNLQVALLSLDSVRFHQSVGAGALLTIKSLCSKIRGNIATFTATIHSDESLVAEGSFMANFSFVPSDAHAAGSHTDSQFA